MKLIVNNENSFRANAYGFSVSPSASGYQVAFSADGVNFTLDSDAVVPANEGLEYIGCVPGTLYKLVGNSGEVTVMI